MTLPARIMVYATAWLTLFLGPLASVGADEPVAAAEEAPVEVAAVEIGQVLALGPLPIATAQFDATTKAEQLRRAVIEHAQRGGSPRAGQSVEVFGTSLPWQAISPGAMPAGTDGQLWLWWVQLDTERFVTGHLEVGGLEEAHLFHGARLIPGGDEGHELVLRNGTHALWLLHQGPAADEAPSLAWRGKAEHDRIVAHTRPERRVSPERLTNAETVSSLAISPDGRYLALAFDGRSDASDLDVRRLEIRDLGENRIVRQWTANRPGAMAWSPDNRFLAIHEGNNLWLHEWPGGEARLLLANHEHLGQIRWLPDSRSIVFAWNEPFKDDDAKTRRLRALEDRWKTFRDNSQLFQVDVASGLVRPLTAGKQSVTLHDIHPSGDRLLLSERLIDYAEPPHSLARVFELRLDTLEQAEVGRYRLFNGILFADDGYWLLAGPSFPGADGATTGENVVPNEFDTQFYRLAADGLSARSLSRDIDSAFNEMHRLHGGDLLLSAEAAERVVLLRFDPRRERFTPVEAGVEVIESMAVSTGRRPVVALRGTDAHRPQRVHVIELDRDRNRVLLDSQPSEYADVVFGRVEPWTFTNADGDTIDGRYYLPPDFDPGKKYPLIVYYYGGTNPVNRQFTGRYPFNLWAAQGYVIYVLQPRGTTGYGQAFSAAHVNAWGKYTADDILEGTQKFLAAHDFVDGARVGNIGASYGGFMTMHLATLTDMYAASISHAGISALTGYWGQGWWGFGYKGIASQGSFPWNNPELYVGQSPVYSADKITTPLLLLTGDSDTNVPPGESHNMYTALKLLGREVELVEVPGQDHWIIDREQRYVWWDTMLAWFDRWLKDEPEWWHHLYPETAEQQVKP